MRHIGQWLALVTIFALSGTPAVAAGAGDPVHGAAVYAATCASCHDANPLDNVNNLMSAANSPTTLQNAIAGEVDMQSIILSLSDITDVTTYLGSLLIVPQTGYWWNTDEGGRGFTIEQNNASGNIFFATYLYNTDGTPTWYAAGPAPMRDNTFTAKLIAYTGGQTLTGAYQSATQSPSSPGKLVFKLTDPSHATLSWPGGTINIQRYEFEPNGLTLPPTATQPQSGYWWNPAEGGRGYTIEVQSNVVFVASYMYDGSGNAVWYASGPAALIGDNTYQGSWSTYGGGQTLFGAYQSASVTGSAGSLTIQFTSPTAGMLTLPDGRQIPIERYVF